MENSALGKTKTRVVFVLPKSERGWTEQEEAKCDRGRKCD